MRYIHIHHKKQTKAWEYIIRSDFNILLFGVVGMFVFGFLKLAHLMMLSVITGFIGYGLHAIVHRRANFPALVGGVRSPLRSYTYAGVVFEGWEANALGSLFVFLGVILFLSYLYNLGLLTF